MTRTRCTKHEMIIKTQIYRIIYKDFMVFKQYQKKNVIQNIYEKNFGEKKQQKIIKMAKMAQNLTREKSNQKNIHIASINIRDTNTKNHHW